jgi:hypothetical protein
MRLADAGPDMQSYRQNALRPNAAITARGCGVIAPRVGFRLARYLGTQNPWCLILHAVTTARCWMIVERGDELRRLGQGLRVMKGVGTH